MTEIERILADRDRQLARFPMTALIEVVPNRVLIRADRVDTFREIQISQRIGALSK